MSAGQEGGRPAESNQTGRGAASSFGIASKAWWPWAGRLLKTGFFALIAWLLVSQARAVEWGSVLATLRQRPVSGLLAAALITCASFALYSCFDLLGRRLTGHRLKTRSVMTVNFICYAFNINLGSMVGSVALRYRLYARLGLSHHVITRVIIMSLLTNWLGYLLLAGLVFLLRPLDLPPGWRIDTPGLQAIGGVLFAAAVGYVLLCGCASKRTWTFGEHALRLPSLRMALLQLAMSSLNWLLMGTVVYTLMAQKVGLPMVLAALFFGAIAGVITHVPAGLGVLEAVFVALLAHQLPKSELLAALIAYRAIYYLVPLAVAAVFYLAVEALAKRDGLPH